MHILTKIKKEYLVKTVWIIEDNRRSTVYALILMNA